MIIRRTKDARRLRMRARWILDARDVYAYLKFGAQDSAIDFCLAKLEACYIFIDARATRVYKPAERKMMRLRTSEQVLFDRMFGAIRADHAITSSIYQKGV